MCKYYHTGMVKSSQSRVKSPESQIETEMALRRPPRRAGATGGSSRLRQGFGGQAGSASWPEADEGRGDWRELILSSEVTVKNEPHPQKPEGAAPTDLAAPPAAQNSHSARRVGHPPSTTLFKGALLATDPTEHEKAECKR
jgi:hypothetical protein